MRPDLRTNNFSQFQSSLALRTDDDMAPITTTAAATATTSTPNTKSWRGLPRRSSLSAATANSGNVKKTQETTTTNNKPRRRRSLFGSMSADQDFNKKSAHDPTQSSSSSSNGRRSKTNSSTKSRRRASLFGNIIESTHKDSPGDSFTSDEMTVEDGGNDEPSPPVSPINTNQATTSPRPKSLLAQPSGRMLVSDHQKRGQQHETKMTSNRTGKLLPQPSGRMLVSSSSSSSSERQHQGSKTLSLQPSGRIQLSGLQQETDKEEVIVPSPTKKDDFEFDAIEQDSDSQGDRDDDDDNDDVDKSKKHDTETTSTKESEEKQEAITVTLDAGFQSSLHLFDTTLEEKLIDTDVSSYDESRHSRDGFSTDGFSSSDDENHPGISKSPRRQRRRANRRASTGHRGSSVTNEPETFSTTTTTVVQKNGNPRRRRSSMTGRTTVVASMSTVANVTAIRPTAMRRQRQQQQGEVPASAKTACTAAPSFFDAKEQEELQHQTVWQSDFGVGCALETTMQQCWQQPEKTPTQEEAPVKNDNDTNKPEEGQESFPDVQDRQDDEVMSKEECSSDDDEDEQDDQVMAMNCSFDNREAIARNGVVFSRSPSGLSEHLELRF